MAIIEKEIKLVGSKGEHELTGLFDSGATYSCIDEDLAKELEILIPLPTPPLFRDSGGGENSEGEGSSAVGFSPGWLPLLG